MIGSLIYYAWWMRQVRRRTYDAGVFETVQTYDLVEAPEALEDHPSTPSTLIPDEPVELPDELPDELDWGNPPPLGDDEIPF